MKVLVLGAGVAGVSCAWYLTEAGHEVTVIDRAEGVAMETSFANAGQLSYGYTTPWAAPGIPTKALKWLFKSHPPLLFRPDGSLYQVEWLWQMLQNCTASRYQINKERMVRISEYSREMFRRFEAQTGMPAACTCLRMRPATATSSPKTCTNCVWKKAYSSISTEPSAASNTTASASAQSKPKRNALKQMPSSARSAASAGRFWRSWTSICPFTPSKAIP